MALPQPKQLKDKPVIQSLESFVTAGSLNYGSVGLPDLSTLSLNELAKTYFTIQTQSQLLQGMVLNEARSKFAGDKEFGNWILEHNLDTGTQQHRTRLMNMARYFKDKSMDGISVTVAYELSSPKHADKADQLYQEIKGKNIPFSEFKKKLVVDVQKSIEDLRVKEPETKKEVETVEEDDDLIDLAMESDDIFEDSQYDYFPTHDKVTPKKLTMIESSDNLEETVVHILLADMSNDQKLIFIERCKEMILSEM